MHLTSPRPSRVLRLVIHLAALAASAVALAGLVGCDDESPCVTGEVLVDEVCVPLLTCGDATTALNGACVLAEPLRCGDATESVNGACMPTSAVCGDGTRWTPAPAHRAPTPARTVRGRTAAATGGRACSHPRGVLDRVRDE